MQGGRAALDQYADGAFAKGMSGSTGLVGTDDRSTITQPGCWTLLVKVSVQDGDDYQDEGEQEPNDKPLFTARSRLASETAMPSTHARN